MAQFSRGHGHFSSLYFYLLPVFFILMFYLLVSLSLRKTKNVMNSNPTFLCYYCLYGGNKMFKLAHSLCLSACVVDDVEEEA